MAISRKKTAPTNYTYDWLNQEVGQGQTRYEELFPRMARILKSVLTKASHEEIEDAIQEYVAYAISKDSLAPHITQGNEVLISNLVDFCARHYFWKTQSRGTQILDRLYNGVRSHAEQSKASRYKLEGGIASRAARMSTKALVDLDNCKVADDVASFEKELISQSMKGRILTAFTRIYDGKGQLHYDVFMAEATQELGSQQERADKLGVTLRQYRELIAQNNETIQHFGKEFFGL
jgi:hypothetical protein